jgi:hypothetical protein
LKAGGAGGSAILELRSAGETGFVFLACALEVADRTCSVDTGNAVNPYVVDFRSAHSQTAKITVTAGNSSRLVDADIVKTHVTVTAYTVGGEQSSISIPIE